MRSFICFFYSNMHIFLAIPFSECTFIPGLSTDPHPDCLSKLKKSCIKNKCVHITNYIYVRPSYYPIPPAPKITGKD